MHCVYINLDRSTERRAQLEENFRANLKEDWTLTRFAAVDGDTEAALIAGTSTPPVKGCFESHRRVIDTFVLPGAPLLIFEDDARIGKLSCTLIDRLQTNLLSSMEWDLVFTDIGITAVGDMAKLVVIQERFIHYNQVKLIDLIEYNFFGTSSYIVNPASKKKLLNILGGPIDGPYDLVLKSLIHSGEIKAFFPFPFITTVAAEAAVSAIQSPKHAREDEILNTFRRMAWIEGDVDSHLPFLNSLQMQVGYRAKAFATLWAAMVDPTWVGH